jgi:hypothetical protein
MMKKHQSGIPITIRLLIIGLGSLICSLAILCLTPPISRDALTHHLAIPKLYLAHGGIYEIPSILFSYYPMNLDLLYMIPIYFGNDTVPKFIHFAFALLTTFFIYRYLHRKLNTAYGLLGAFLFLSIPIVVKLSITAYVDLGLIFFSTAALLFLLKWLEKDFSFKYLILAAIFCGLGMGTKYNGLISFALLTLFVPFLYSRANQEDHTRAFRAVAYGLSFMTISLLVFSPWLIRNYIWTGNPVFPLYNNLFNPQMISGASIGIFQYRSLAYHETWWQMVLLPIRIFFQGQDNNPQYFDGKLNPILLFLPILAFYRKREDPRDIRNEKKILLVFSVLFFGFAFFTSGLRMRYIAPIIPPLVILSVFGIRQVFQKVADIHSRNGRRVCTAFVFGVVAFTLGMNGIYVYEQFKEVVPFDFLSGRVSRGEYISKYRREYPAIQYVNKNLPPDALVLFIFIGNRGYYCDKDYQLDNGWLYKIIKKADSPEFVLFELKNRGITHLFISHNIFDKWKKGIFNDKELYILDEFIKKYCKILFFKWGYGVSRLENFDLCG